MGEKKRGKKKIASIEDAKSDVAENHFRESEKGLTHSSKQRESSVDTEKH